MLFQLFEFSQKFVFIFLCADVTQKSHKSITAKIFFTFSLKEIFHQ